MSDHSSAVEGVARIVLWVIRFAVIMFSIMMAFALLGWLTS